MESLTRWMDRQANPWLPFYRFGTGAVAVLFLIALAIAVGQTALGSPAPPEAWGVVSALLLATLTSVILLRRVPPPRRDMTSLASLQNAAWQGKLAEALGESAPAAERAAVDLEQTEALLPHAGLEPAFAASLLEAANFRLKRMLDLTVGVPGHYGLTLDGAKTQFAEDAHWLAEVRRLVERTREAPLEPSDDTPFRHLERLVQAREEALLELRQL